MDSISIESTLIDSGSLEGPPSVYSEVLLNQQGVSTLVSPRAADVRLC